MAKNLIEIIKLRTNDDYQLNCFFSKLKESGSDKTFHPHPFTREAADKICDKDKQIGNDDLYVAIKWENHLIVGYGFLKGFEEGYEIPHLGIAITKEFRGKGLSKLLMNYLHTSARMRGCKEIYLKVYKDNEAAVNLYRKLGYELEETNDKELAGTIKL